MIVSLQGFLLSSIIIKFSSVTTNPGMGQVVTTVPNICNPEFYKCDCF